MSECLIKVSSPLAKQTCNGKTNQLEIWWQKINLFCHNSVTMVHCVCLFTGKKSEHLLEQLVLPDHRWACLFLYPRVWLYDWRRYSWASCSNISSSFVSSSLLSTVAENAPPPHCDWSGKVGRCLVGWACREDGQHKWRDTWSATSGKGGIDPNPGSEEREQSPQSQIVRYIWTFCFKIHN